MAKQTPFDIVTFDGQKVSRFFLSALAACSKKLGGQSVFGQLPAGPAAIAAAQLGAGLKTGVFLLKVDASTVLQGATGGGVKIAWGEPAAATIGLALGLPAAKVNEVLSAQAALWLAGKQPSSPSPSLLAASGQSKPLPPPPPPKPGDPPLPPAARSELDNGSGNMIVKVGGALLGLGLLAAWVDGMRKARR